MVKKLAYIFSCIIFFTACNSEKNYTKQETEIIAGKGFDKFAINQTIDAVISELGNDYKEIEHNGYSIQIEYEKIGVSFYYKQDDNEKKVFVISVVPPFNAITEKKIKLGDPIEKAIKIYGKPFWNSCDGCDIWRATYEDIGVEFMVQRDTTLPHYPLNEKAHMNKKIIDISVMMKDEE